MASEDVELTLLNLEGLAADSMGQVLWRRFNRSSLQIQRDSSDRLVIPRDLREAAGLGLGELIWLGDRNKIRLFSPENWALYVEIEEADLDFSEGGSLATERGRTGGLI
jgi:DNA-binding transcriptional regulator/RsmH inhibitor MraZ|tara:strand:+ start:655 stop:981 length:327 start_codon:yes stop_codon:yes gene_type:complete